MINITKKCIDTPDTPLNSADKAISKHIIAHCQIFNSASIDERNPMIVFNNIPC